MNPVWRGVGCFLIVTLAIGGYLFSNWFLTQNYANQWVYLPPQIIAPSMSAIPASLQSALAPLFGPGVMASLVVAFLFLVFAYLFLSIAYSIAFPIKPGEHDVPPLKRVRRRPR
jgi:hypothetical protein